MYVCWIPLVYPLWVYGRALHTGHLENSLLVLRKLIEARHWWFMPVILATQEAEIRRITIRSQLRQIVLKTLSRKIPITKKGWWSSSRHRS
jgi:hypothetical protein